jgi:hypothetical protein
LALKSPPPLDAKLIVPVGVVGSFSVSVTVAVHVVGWSKTTLSGEQLTTVDVASGGV